MGGMLLGRLLSPGVGAEFIGAKDSGETANGGMKEESGARRSWCRLLEVGWKVIFFCLLLLRCGAGMHC
jgi:hypothetical protein